MPKPVKEQISNDCTLFYRVGKGYFKPFYNFDDIPLDVFYPKGNGLSVNWIKYCHTPNDCLAIKTPVFPEGRTNKTHGVGHFIAGEVRIEGYGVEHAPKEELSHSEILNIPPKEDEQPFLETMVNLRRIFKKWDIKPLVDI